MVYCRAVPAMEKYLFSPADTAKNPISIQDSKVQLKYTIKAVLFPREPVGEICGRMKISTVKLKEALHNECKFMFGNAQCDLSSCNCVDNSMKKA